MAYFKGARRGKSASSSSRVTSRPVSVSFRVTSEPKLRTMHSKTHSVVRIGRLRSPTESREGAISSACFSTAARAAEGRIADSSGVDFFSLANGCQPRARSPLRRRSVVELDPGMPPLGADSADSAQKTFDFFAIFLFPIYREALPIGDVHAGEQVRDFDYLRCSGYSPACDAKVRPRQSPASADGCQLVNGHRHSPAEGGNERTWSPICA